METKIFFEKKRKKECLPPKKLKNPPKKVAYLWQLGFFFFAAPTAQNSPELHFCYFIQLSLLEYSDKIFYLQLNPFRNFIQNIIGMKLGNRIHVPHIF